MVHLLSTIALGPLLLLQGYNVRRTVPKLPEATGQRSGTVGAGDSLSLLILGDSAAAGVGVSHQEHALLGQLSEQLGQHFKLRYQLFARTGATTASTLAELPLPGGDRFDVAVTSLGVNDVISQVSSKQWLRRQRELRNLLRKHHGVAHVVITQLPPMRYFPALPQPLRWYLGRRADQFSNLLAADLVAEPDCDFLRMEFERDPALMASDGFHPGAEIYRRWAKQVAERVRKRRLTEDSQ